MFSRAIGQTGEAGHAARHGDPVVPLERPDPVPSDAVTGAVVRRVSDVAVLVFFIDDRLGRQGKRRPSLCRRVLVGSP